MNCNDQTILGVCLRRPVALETTRVWRTGQGGRELGRLLGTGEESDGHCPEDWIMSTVPARNAGREDLPDEGLSYLSGHRLLLRDLIAAAPDEILGARHAAQFGPVPGVLSKIIDSSERATIQVHPDKQTAARLFHAPFGKTECWHVLALRPDAPEPPCVYLGFRPGVTREQWMDVFARQGIPAMLACMNRFPVHPGDTWLVEAGVPHAVSANFMFLELQEPTDFTIRTERQTPGGMPVPDRLCHQGLGFEAMFDCFHYGEPPRDYRVPRRTLAETPNYSHYELVGYAQTSCFRLHRLEIRTACPLTSGCVCSALFVYAGHGTLSCAGQDQPLRPGVQYMVPACCEDMTLTAAPDETLTVFRCYGPELKERG